MPFEPVKKLIPYFPDLIESVVERVNERIDSEDMICSFELGYQNDVAKSIYKKVTKDKVPGLPLFWLVSGYQEKIINSRENAADITCDILIATSTDPKQTIKERIDNVFKEVLYPVYDLFMDELGKQPGLSTGIGSTIPHTKIDWPYWGGGDANGPGSKNLFGNYIDAIHLKGLRLKTKKYCPPT